MRFWDSSALVPLIVSESRSSEMRALAGDRRRMSVWWAASVECTSAVARRERAGDLRPPDVVDALTTLEQLAQEWSDVPPSGRLRDEARRIVRVHDLRAADGLQLAAAKDAATRAPGLVPFVTLDDRLALAAQREGFPIIP